MLGADGKQRMWADWKKFFSKTFTFWNLSDPSLTLKRILILVKPVNPTTFVHLPLVVWSISRVPTESGKLWKKSLVLFQPGKVWKKFFWSVSIEKRKSFPGLIFWHAFWSYFVLILFMRLIILHSSYHSACSTWSCRSGNLSPKKFRNFLY